MAEIPCRRCDSPDCKGCNIYTLATALQQGKFEPLMDGNRTVHIAASVRENVTGEWIEDRTDIVCPKCHATYSDEIVFMNRNMLVEPLKYCPNCGAEMTGGNDG